MFVKERKENREGYRDGKLGCVKLPNKSVAYVKGWNKGFKKFVMANPKAFFKTGSKKDIKHGIEMLDFIGLKPEFIEQAVESLEETCQC